MEKSLTDTDIKNILALINIAPLKGAEAMTVAVLQQKLNNLLTPQPAVEANSETGTNVSQEAASE